MTLDVKFFCESCNAGPWHEGDKGSGGIDIIDSHVRRGCKVREYRPEEHRNLTDSINSFIDDLNESEKKRSDERKERLERFGPPIKQIEQYLETQVRNDPRIIKQLLRVYFSAYTDNPINMAILAPSSDGKTHATVQVSKIFPKEDFITVGRLSPTALIHQYGVMVDENYNPIEKKLQQLQQIVQTSKNPEEVYETKQAINEILRNSKNLVDLTNKVLLFLDNPNPQTYEVLKPILSHDKREILYKTTKGDGSLKVKETIIRGWPATIVCSAKNEAKNEVWPEIETRFFMTSPNSDVSKYQKANELTTLKFGLPKWAEDVYDNSTDRKWAQMYVSEIIESLKKHPDLWCPLYEVLNEFFPNNQGVMMRHLKRLLSFCNVETMINMEHRPTLEYKSKNDEIVRTWVGTFEDISNAIDTLGNISTIPPEKLRFYDDVFVPLFKEKNSIQQNIDEKQAKLMGNEGVTSADLADKYTNVYKKPITAKQIRENYLNILTDEGVIIPEENETNKKQYVFFPTNGIAIHKLEDLKSSIIANSPIKKFKYDYVIPCLKLFNQLTGDFRKTPLIFIQDKQVLNLEGLVSEINRQSSPVFEGDLGTKSEDKTN